MITPRPGWLQRQFESAERDFWELPAYLRQRESMSGPPSGNSVVESIHSNAGLLFGYLERILGSGSIIMSHEKEVFQYFWYPSLSEPSQDWNGSYESHVPCNRLSHANPKMILGMAHDLAGRMKSDLGTSPSFWRVSTVDA